MNKKENQHVEWKESWRDDYLKCICGFANSNGGKLYIGIDDKGKVTGIKKSKRLLEDVPNKIRNYLGVIAEVNLLEKEDNEYLEIKVEPYDVPISYHGKYYIRSGSTNQLLVGKDLNRFLLTKSGKGWDEVFEDTATLENIESDTVVHFKTLKENRIPSLKKEDNFKVIIESLHLVEGKNVKRAAILLFGKDPKKFYPGAFVKIGRFKTDTELVTQDTLEGNLFQLVEKVLEILLGKYLTSPVSYEGLYRKESPEYPFDALREAIINALIHKDYTGDAIQISVYDDKMIIWNEGGLHSGLTIEDLKRNHPSKARNKLLADVFFKAGLIEAWGRGTLNIIDAFNKREMPEPSFSEKAGGFELIFRKDIIYLEHLRTIGLKDRQIKAVLFVKESSSINNSKYQGLTGTTKKTATRDLQELVEYGIFEKTGSTGRGVKYTLK